MRSKELGKAPFWMPVDNTYRYDSNVKFLGKKSYNTAEGVQIHVDEATSKPRDYSNCLDSSLLLTSRKKLSDIIQLTTPAQQYPRTYVTYFADTYGWVDNISPDTRCWYVESSTKTQEQMERDGELPAFNFETPYSEMSSEMLFEVELLSQNLLRIAHWDGYKKTYLTSNDKHLTVLFDFENTHELTVTNPQVFEYSLDTNISCINIYRKIGEHYFEFRYIPQNKLLSYASTVHTNYIPNTFKNAVSRIDKNELVLNENWVKYNSNLIDDDITIDVDGSYNNLSHNYVLNTEYIYDDGTTNNWNILTLKNHLTDSSRTSINNPFAGSVDNNQPGGGAEKPTLFREYTSLNQGPGDSAGYENLYLGYSSHTCELQFKADEITYFHIPTSIYPYNKLNVAQAGLIESGSIAGDQPIKSDKIFKKRANYASSSPWGNPTDEHDGNFLCTWLYWSGKTEEPPIWLDRYYNPKHYTIHDALTANPIVRFTTTFDNMAIENPDTKQYVIFDKVSDMCFEPESLYCYHRIGQTDIQNIIGKLKADIVQQDIHEYRNTSGNIVIPDFDNNQPVYNFTGQTYGHTKSLTDLAINNSYSINFSMYSDDWSKPFGNQLIGNYTNDGFGIFNKEMITPFLYSNEGDVKMYNTSLQQLLTFPVSSLITIKNPATENIFIYNNDNNGTIYEFNTTGVLEEKTRIIMYDRGVYPPRRLKAIDYTTDGRYLYLQYNDDSYFSTDLTSEALQDHPGEIIKLHATGVEEKTAYSHLFAHDNKIYTVNSQHAPLIDTVNNMWWLHHNTVYRYKIDQEKYTSVFSTTDYVLKKLLLDVDNNMYIVYRDYVPNPKSLYDYKLLKIDTNLNILYNESLSSFNQELSALSPDEAFNINMVAEFNDHGYQHYMSMLTEYTSTYSVIDIDTGERHTVEIDMTSMTNINTTGEAIDVQLINQPYTNLANVVSDYNSVKQKYPTSMAANELIFKTKIKDLYNRDEAEEIVLSTDVSTFKPGWKHISYDFNTINGKIILFIDGELIGVRNFTPMKYRYSDVNISKYTIGASPYYGGLTLGQFLNKPTTYCCRNFKMKQLYIYNKSLNYFDLKFLYRQIATIRDINWVVPGNNRNYVDEVQHTFAHRRPAMKSNNYSVNILCDSIKDSELRKQLTEDIMSTVKQSTPVNSNIDNVTWYTTK